MTAIGTLISRGATGSRPTAGTAGALFFDTTLGKLQRDNGSSWDDAEAVSPQGPAGKLGYAQITANLTTTSTSMVDASGLSIAVTVGTRPIKITVFAQRCMHTVANGKVAANIFDTTGSAQVASAIVTDSGISTGNPLVIMAANLTPAAGARSYKVQFEALDAGTATIAASATAPAFILAEEI